MFEEGWEPWLPTYAEVIHDYEGAFGFPALDISSSLYPNITAHSNILSTMFYERYCNRRIGYETLVLWQIKLQHKFDQIAQKYERGFKLYEDNATAMDKAVEGSLAVSGGTSKTIDTPDSSINASDNYAEAVSKDDRTAESTVKGSRAVSSVNENIMAYGNLEDWFVGEFENLFLNILE